MKIKKNYQNPKTTKCQKKQKKEASDYKGVRFDVWSTGCVTFNTLYDYFYDNKNLKVD